ALAGLPVEPEPFKPVLRGLLLTGMAARYLRNEPGAARADVDTEALWWPPVKIVGRHLAPFLATKLGLSESESAAPGHPLGGRRAPAEGDDPTAGRELAPAVLLERAPREPRLTWRKQAGVESQPANSEPPQELPGSRPPFAAVQRLEPEREVRGALRRDRRVPARTLPLRL